MDTNKIYTMEELKNMTASDREALARHHGIKPEGKHHLRLSCEIWDAQNPVSGNQNQTS